MGKTRILIASLLLVFLVVTMIWLSLPARRPVFSPQSNTATAEKKRPPGSTAAKLGSIRFPAFKVEDISVAEFVDYLRVRSIAYDENPGDFPGVDIRIMPPGEGFHEDIDRGMILTGNYRIRELALSNMSLEEVLRFAFGGGKIRYAVRDEVLWIHGPADAYKKEPDPLKSPALKSSSGVD